MAFFNVTLGFGAQTLDCINAHVSLVQYKVPEKITRGSYVMFVAPKAMGQPFTGHLAIKEVGAVPGDHVVIAHNELYINGRKIGPLDVAEKAAKRMHVAITSFAKDEIVPAGKIFVIGTMPHTFDSRYWGYADAGSVVGRAVPLI